MLLGETIDILKLSDFGLARKNATVDRSLTYCVGTIQYMAPEVIKAEYYDTTADIYSLGISIWEMFHRKHPFDEHKSQYNLFEAIVAGARPKIQMPLQDEMKELILMSFQPSPSSRPKAADFIELAEKLYQIVPPVLQRSCKMEEVNEIGGALPSAVLRNELRVSSYSQGLDEDYAVPPSPPSPGLVAGRFPSPSIQERVQLDHLDKVEVELLEVISVEGNSRQDATEEQGLVTRTVLDISDPNFNVAHYDYLFDLRHRHFLRNYHFLRRGTAYPQSRISAIVSEYVSRLLEHANMPLDLRVALGLIHDLFIAIMFLERENVVHGRIAPWRIFFDESEVLKLHLVPHQLIPLDTGNEWRFEHEMSWGQENMNTNIYSRFRNRVYTADEVRDDYPPNEKSDVYSAVSVAYRILEGRDPPLDKTGLYFPFVSPDTNQLLTRSWAPPENRPTVEELLNAIESEIRRVNLAV